MKKIGRSHVLGDAVPEYDARSGIKGRYATPLMVADSGAVLHVWAPLINFPWSGPERKLADTRLRSGQAYRGYEDVPAFKSFLSETDREECQGARHWLFFTHQRSELLSTRAKMNSVLLMLWIVRPTRAYVPLRLETADSDVHTASRVLERFQWIAGQAEESVRDEDLQRVADLLPVLRHVYASGGRLRNALALTFRGCGASEWQSAYICFAAAAEALLTYSSRPGLTARLARSYAELVAQDSSKREKLGEDFRRLYRTRSDIVHGRAFELDDPARNVRHLGEFADAVRCIWMTVLEKPRVRAALDEDDEGRASYFRSLA